MDFRIRKGLDIRLDGAARREVRPLETVRYYVSPSDFRWLKPQLRMQAGSEVEVGTPLFASKDDERVVVVSPVKGTVREIVRGERRSVETIVLEAFPSDPFRKQVDFTEPETSDEVASLLLSNGLWPFLRQRPFSVIPSPDSRPKSLFIRCFDSAPLAPEHDFLLQGRAEEFREGVRRLHQLVGAGCPIHLCLRDGAENACFEAAENVQFHHFSGPHPAGNVGPQIHRIDPIDKGECVWYIHSQDVAAIGRFFLTHTLSFERMVAITGPCIKSPRYYTMVYGADISTILQEQIEAKNVRIISGNILTGQQLSQFPHVGLYDTQLTVIAEGGEREFIGWLLPGFRKWSLSHTFTAWLFRRKTFRHNTSLHGGRRAFVMTDVYEKVFPFEILPLQLLKACLTDDIEQMEELGIYEVDDEDFALCEVVCPSKMEWQKTVRTALYKIYKNT